MKWIMIIFIVGTIACQAKTIYVATNGLNSRTGEDYWTNAVQTISNGVSKAASGDTVLISNGTYAVSHVVINDITVRGLNGYSNTFCDGGGSAGVFYMYGTTTLLEGLTLTNGYLGEGGGIRIDGGTMRNCAIVNCTADDGAGVSLHAGVISNCVIAKNVCATGQGGGVHISAVGDCRVAQCLINGNSCSGGGGSGYGAGVYMVGGVVTGCVIKGNSSTQYGIVAMNGAAGNNAVVQNCTISENSAVVNAGIFVLNAGVIQQCMINNNTGSAATVYFYQNGNHRIYDSWILSNSASDWAGLYINSSCTNVEVRNCLIAYNSSTWAAVRLMSPGLNSLANCTIVSNVCPNAGGIYFASGSAGTATNCIVYNNVGVNYAIFTGGSVTGSMSYCCTTPLPDYGSNNTTNPPLFVNKDTGDFRLASDSPCINTGTNMGWMAGATDLDARPRLDHFRRQVDMGAYEFLSSGTIFTF